VRFHFHEVSLNILVLVAIMDNSFPARLLYIDRLKSGSTVSIYTYQYYTILIMI